jgi:ribosomal protein S18 acetylase RimI-like enzyme
VALSSASAEQDVRAVYGGLQLACGLLLALAAGASEAAVRAGLAAQLALYGGLAGARLLGLALTGAPGALGAALHAGELVALGAGTIAWRRLARAPRARTRGIGDSPVSLACATGDDLAALLPLVEAFQREEGYPTGDPALGDAVAALLADEGAGRVVLARAGCEVVGYAALCFGFSIEHRGRDAFVDELYVQPGRRGAGLGRALLRALETEAVAAGVRTLHLEVERDNPRARALYVAEGFAATRRELLSKTLRS